MKPQIRREISAYKTTQLSHQAVFSKIIDDANSSCSHRQYRSVPQKNCVCAQLYCRKRMPQKRHTFAFQNFHIDISSKHQSSEMSTWNKQTTYQTQLAAVFKFKKEKKTHTSACKWIQHKRIGFHLEIVFSKLDSLEKFR